MELFNYPNKKMIETFKVIPSLEYDSCDWEQGRPKDLAY